jgi:ribosome-associated protein
LHLSHEGAAQLEARHRIGGRDAKILDLDALIQLATRPWPDLDADSSRSLATTRMVSEPISIQAIVLAAKIQPRAQPHSHRQRNRLNSGAPERSPRPSYRPQRQPHWQEQQHEDLATRLDPDRLDRSAPIDDEAFLTQGFVSHATPPQLNRLLTQAGGPGNDFGQARFPSPRKTHRPAESAATTFPLIFSSHPCYGSYCANPIKEHFRCVATPRHGARGNGFPRNLDQETALDLSIKALETLILSRLDDDKAQDIVHIDLTDKSSVADSLIVASGRSHRHVGALADHIIRALKESGFGKARVEGLPHCDWVLIDAGDVVVHLFRPEVRSFYNIEKIWAVDAPHRMASN